MNWTEFDADDQAIICLNLITWRGRATPRVWHTVYKSTLEGRRNGYEDEVLECLKAALPEGVRVMIIADPGFGDQKRYEQLTELGSTSSCAFAKTFWSPISLATRAPPANGSIRRAVRVCSRTWP